jgi:hypothetical protein
MVLRREKAVNQEERALKICCRACRAGAGERCFDLRPGYRGLRKKHLCSTRVVDARPKGKR